MEEVKDKREEEQVKIIDKILLDLHKHARRCGYICIYPRARPRALKHPKLHVATLDYQCLGRGDRVQSDYSVRRERWKRDREVRYRAELRWSSRGVYYSTDL